MIMGRGKVLRFSSQISILYCGGNVKTLSTLNINACTGVHHFKSFWNFFEKHSYNSVRLYFFEKLWVRFFT